MDTHPAGAREKCGILFEHRRQRNHPPQQNKNRRRHLGTKRKLMETDLGKNHRTRPRKPNQAGKYKSVFIDTATIIIDIEI